VRISEKQTSLPKGSWGCGVYFLFFFIFLSKAVYQGALGAVTLLLLHGADTDFFIYIAQQSSLPKGIGGCDVAPAARRWSKPRFLSGQSTCSGKIFFLFFLLLQGADS
jgi:hypothetical protein